MMRKYLAPLLLPATLIWACSKPPRPEDAAAKAAKEYYTLLIKGRYSEYVSGIAGTDSIPDSYREQLTVNAEQFVAMQKSNHGGIVDISVADAVADTARHSASVFLMLHFADSLKEEVVVPMAHRNGRWMMR